MKTHRPLLYLLAVCLLFSSCSIEVKDGSFPYPASYFRTLVEKYNRYSYEYSFLEENGAPIDSAVNFFISNYLHQMKGENGIQQYSNKDLYICPASVIEATVQAHFNLASGRFSSKYYSKHSGYYLLPDLEETPQYHRVQVSGIEQLTENRYQVKAEILNLIGNDNIYSVTMRQTFIIETDGEHFKYLAVTKDWELPGYYTQDL